MERVGLGEGDRFRGRHRHQGWVGRPKQRTRTLGQFRLFGQSLSIGPIYGVERVRAFRQSTVGRAALQLLGETHEVLEPPRLNDA